MRAAKALVNLPTCADLPEPALLTDAISTKISCFDTYGKQKVPLAFDTAHFIKSWCQNACLILFLILCFFCLFVLLLYVLSQ